MADAETAPETAAAETSDDSATAEETAATAGADAASTEAEKALGDPGKKALDAMKAERNQFRDDLKAIRSEFEAFRAKAEGKEAEFTAAQEAQRVKDEALAAANQKILKAELRAAAKGKLTDPSDIFRFPEIVDLSALEVGADGEVDATALEAAVTDLVTKRPDLAVQDGKRFQGTGDGGPRNAAKSQLTREDLKGMTPDAILEAQAAGRLKQLTG